MDFRRIGWLALAAVIIYAVVKDPGAGSHAAHGIASFFTEAAQAVGNLMGSL